MLPPSMAISLFLLVSPPSNETVGKLEPEPAPFHLPSCFSLQGQRDASDRHAAGMGLGVCIDGRFAKRAELERRRCSVPKSSNQVSASSSSYFPLISVARIDTHLLVSTFPYLPGWLPTQMLVSRASSSRARFSTRGSSFPSPSSLFFSPSTTSLIFPHLSTSQSFSRLWSLLLYWNVCYGSSQGSHPKTWAFGDFRLQ